jgi:tyrosinase
MLVAIHQASMKLIYNNDIPLVNIAHGGPSFLPWHRYFLAVTESALQTFSNSSSLKIPYWNWTIDFDVAGGPLNSIVWTEDYFGDKGDIFTLDVTKGPFRRSKWELKPYLNGPVLQRQVGYNYPLVPSKINVNRMLSNTIYDDFPYTNDSRSFRSSVEGWNEVGHNAVHSFVGGSMTNFSSVNDPVFLLHHAFVDNIWSRWQSRTKKRYRPSKIRKDLHKSPISTKLKDGSYSILGQLLEHPMWPFSKLISSIINDAPLYE